MAKAEIRAYLPEDYSRFKVLFGAYMEREFSPGLPEPKLESFCADITQLVAGGIAFLDILAVEGAPEGFILYQVDSTQSDWCEKEGLGFIRELYVPESLRGRGYGKRLAARAEEALFALGVRAVYLTSEKNGSFWEKCGYRNTGEISSKNHDPIYNKNFTNTTPSIPSSS